MTALAVVAVVLLVVLALLSSLWGLGFYAVWKAFCGIFQDS